MQQDNAQIYYIVIDEKSTGPFTLDEVILNPKLTPDTLVWKPGIDNWSPAKNFPELDIAFRRNGDTPEFNSPPEYNQPHHFADNPQYQNNHSYYRQERHNPYYHQQRYNPEYRPNIRTNWLPWAIVATILGFFTSCIGAIFGIIGIVQANKANTFYAQGFDREGDAANSNARIMTIIGLIFAGLGIIAAIWFGSFFSTISSLAYQ